ncbi:MAG: transcriptional regulator [Promethearchaeota archaeon]
MDQNPLTVEELLEDLDSTLHEPVRLGILILLHLNSSLPFSKIQKGLGVTSGNLNTHLKRLEEFELIIKERTFIDTRPRTVIYITDKGRKSLKKYSKSLKQILIGIGEM